MATGTHQVPRARWIALETHLPADQQPPAGLEKAKKIGGASPWYDPVPAYRGTTRRIARLLRSNLVRPAGLHRQRVSGWSSCEGWTRMTHRLTTAAAAVVLVAAVASGATVTFLSTWKSPGAGPLNFAGRKVAASSSSTT